MSNWQLLDYHRFITGILASTPEDGFNGAFLINIDGSRVKIIASDGLFWKHVSVSYMDSIAPPTWSIMCKVKDLFWDDEDWVVQYHPAKSAYIDNHPGVLHLWECLNEKMPTPPSIMVGLKELNPSNP